MPGCRLKSAVAGIAMGLVMDEQELGVNAALSDIAGAEDHDGDMDFKVAGTADDITALQMDIKVGGITTEVMRKALAPLPAAHPRERCAKRSPHRARASRGVRAPHRHHPLLLDKIRDANSVRGGEHDLSIIERTGVKIDVEDAA